MQVVLLAAGQGIRLKEIHDNLPKTLIPLGDLALVDYIYESLRAYLKEPLVVVGGYAHDKLEKHFQSKGYFHTFSLNPDYLKGNLLSLLSVKNKVTDSFFIMNADHAYSSQIMSQIMALDEKVFDGVAIVCDHDRKLTDDDMKVQLKDDGTFQVMDKKCETYNLGYIGVTYVPKKLHAAYWKACDEVLHTFGEKANVEMVVNYL
ncbi:NTP transferase domain-containing protein, partial [bacterium]|nr:NTP transferase domain-containing protein [bacterium]